MKKKILFILALAVLFSACKMKLSENIGTVVIDFGSNERAVDSKGLPVLKDASMRLEINSPSQGTQKIDFATGKEKKWSGSFPIGEKLTIKVAVKTAAAEWTGSAEHTVTEGTNTVAVKLSKAPKSVGNILIEVDDSGDSCTLKMESGKVLVSKAWINTHHGTYPITARDKIGRIYVLYKEGSFGSATPHFKRYDTEGNEDNGFEAAITGKLPSGVTLNQIKTMTVDAKTGTIFIVGMDASGAEHAYAVTEKGHNNFTLSNGFDLASVIESGSTVQTAAAYNGTLFFTVPLAYGAYGMENKLVAVKAELSGSALTLTKKDEKTLPKLRTAGAFGNYPTNCTGLFADESGVYCLLSEQELRYGNLYALGQIVRYQYSGSTFTGETKVGLNPAASTADPIPFDAQYFSNPVGFIGYDEENIYIADDGVGIQYVNENYHVNGNKNRIAAFNRKTNEITFTDTAATWYEQKPEYKYPNTKILLWKKGDGSTYYGMQYWVADTANTAIPATPADALWFSNQPAVTPTDVFCYDQDGNLYILYKDGSDYKVRQFALKEDGSYEKAAAQDLNLRTSDTVYAIAVDVSNGRNYLYYYTETSTDKKIERFKWEDVFFNFGSKDPDYTITLSSGKVTALAANKDGVFVATKEQSTSDDPYTLKIKKYKKDGSPNGEKTIAYDEGGDNPTDHSAINYTNTDGTVCGLQVIDGVLYALRHNIKKTMKYNTYTTDHACDEFRSSGVLYKVGQTANTFTGSYDKEFKKEFIDPLPSDPSGTKGTGYGFYRFIAVKPKKLIIASDGAWGKDGTLVGFGSAKYQDTDKVLEYDLAGALQHERNSGGSFSKKLTTDSSGFVWQ